MGYQIPKSEDVLRISFEKHPGLEVFCRATKTVQEYFDIQRLTVDITDISAEIEKGDVSPHLRAQLADKELAFREILEDFAEHALISWNVEDGGIALPATLEGVKKLSLEFAMEIIAGWMRGTGEISAPLGVASTNGHSSTGPTRTAGRSPSRPRSRKPSSSTPSANGGV